MREATCRPLSGSASHVLVKSPATLLTFSKIAKQQYLLQSWCYDVWRNLEQGVRMSYIDEKAFLDTVVCKLGFEGNQGSGALS